jgi:hypothetical protein
MKKEKYKEILEKEALPSGKALNPGEKWVFQQDNDPKHSSKLCKNYLQTESTTQNFDVMIWPPQSPDLSPIELLWDEVDRQVQAKRPTNKTDLEALIKQVWSEMSTDILDKLIHRLPLLCQAVIAAEGGYFDEKLSAIKKEYVYH